MWGSPLCWVVLSVDQPLLCSTVATRVSWPLTLPYFTMMEDVVFVDIHMNMNINIQTSNAMVLEVCLLEVCPLHYTTCFRLLLRGFKLLWQDLDPGDLIETSWIIPSAFIWSKVGTSQRWPLLKKPLGKEIQIFYHCDGMMYMWCICLEATWNKQFFSWCNLGVAKHSVHYNYNYNCAL